MSAALSLVEKNDLTYNEQIISKGIGTFREVGEALQRIRDGRLYRAEFANFEDYCREKWDLGRRYVNQMIEAAEAVKELGAMAPKVETERVARAVAKVEPSVRVEVVERAVEKAKERGSDRITARDVEEARKPAGNVPCYMRKVGSTYVSWAQQYAQMAIDQLAKISDSDPERDAAFGRVATWLDKKLNK